MKKLTTVVLGAILVSGTAAFADDAKKTAEKTVEKTADAAADTSKTADTAKKHKKSKKSAHPATDTPAKPEATK